MQEKRNHETTRNHTKIGSCCFVWFRGSGFSVLMRWVLLRLITIILTFAVALSVTFGWQLLPVFHSSPDSSQRLIGVLTPAIIEPGWAGRLVETESPFWVFRRENLAAKFDVNYPVALPTPNVNLISTGCQTLVITMDEARKLKLNIDDVGSLNDPSLLERRLLGIFRERESYRAYKPGMEYRSELPSHERIEKTILIIAPSSLSYGEVLELVSIVEQTGASPVVLQAGDFAQPVTPPPTSSYESDNF